MCLRKGGNNLSPEEARRGDTVNQENRGPVAFVEIGEAMPPDKYVLVNQMAVVHEYLLPLVE
jgi:hypothetical protein